MVLAGWLIAIVCTDLNATKLIYDAGHEFRISVRGRGWG